MFVVGGSISMDNSIKVDDIVFVGWPLRDGSKKFHTILVLNLCSQSKLKIFGIILLLCGY